LRTRQRPGTGRSNPSIEIHLLMNTEIDGDFFQYSVYSVQKTMGQCE